MGFRLGEIGKKMSGFKNWEKILKAEEYPKKDGAETYVDNLVADFNPGIDETPVMEGLDDNKSSFKWAEALSREGLFHKIRLFHPYTANRTLVRSGMK
jgi:hypothetical protein